MDVAHASTTTTQTYHVDAARLLANLVAEGRPSEFSGSRPRLLLKPGVPVSRQSLPDPDPLCP